jgi:hypothetical protein
MFRSIFLLSLVFLTSSLHAASGSESWLSIAFDPYSGAYGRGVGYTPEDAAARATRDIPSRYWDDPAWCMRCIALATTPKLETTERQGYAIQCGVSLRDAERKALGRCYQWGACGILTSFCAR